MRAISIIVLALQASPLVLAGRQDANTNEQDEERLAQLAKRAYEVAESQLGADDFEANNRLSSCTWESVRVRREWGSLSEDERISYTDAVRCLQSKPAVTPSEAAPGAKSRFDDFVATHINQSMTIHYTGNFLSWHRYYTFLYEEALQQECGYEGTQPYWDWAKTARTGWEESPIFDGSPTSMSGDGEYVEQGGDIILGASTGLPPVYLPTANGGGCVTSGPFRNMTVNLGPAALDLPGGEVGTNPEGPLAYNPRCLSRDLSNWVNREFANATATLLNILQPQNVYDFQMQMQGVPGSGNIGIHGGGHYMLGGDPARDVLVSPGEPMFYLHHSMIDRVWWIWQMLSPQERQFSDDAVMGTNTFLNDPPSEETTMDDWVDFGFAAGPPRQIKELTSTLSGPFCYVYL